MNEIALANFYRVLNDADRFPQEHELAEAAIAAKDELNALRAPLPEARGAEARYKPDADLINVAAFEVRNMLGRISPRFPSDAEIAAIIRKHMQHSRGWQPIETAPKDGTHIIVWPYQHMRYKRPMGDKRPGEAYWHQPGNPEHEGFWIFASGLGYRAEHPTHWQPLPASPSPEDK